MEILSHFFENVIGSIPYIGLVLILVPTLGFVLMNKVMTRGINLREALDLLPFTH